MKQEHIQRPQNQAGFKPENMRFRMIARLHEVVLLLRSSKQLCSFETDNPDPACPKNEKAKMFLYTLKENGILKTDTLDKEAVSVSFHTRIRY